MLLVVLGGEEAKWVLDFGVGVWRSYHYYLFVLLVVGEYLEGFGRVACFGAWGGLGCQGLELTVQLFTAQRRLARRSYG